MLKIHTMLFLILICASCSTKQGGGAVLGSQNVIQERTPVGGILTMENSNYRVVQNYSAASGRQCRKLLAVDQLNTDMRVACRNAVGSWYLRKPIMQRDRSSGLPQSTQMSATMSAPLSNFVPTALPVTRGVRKVENANISGTESQAIDVVASSGSQPTAADYSAEEHIKAAIHEDESLWAFAKRVTGNGFNWQVIAQANEIEDVTRIIHGRELRVPAALALASGE